jgi:hypothetical protein
MTTAHDTALLRLIAEMKPARLAAVEKIMGKADPRYFAELRTALASMNKTKS